MTKTTPKVSVCIPAYKMGAFISEALESVCQQTYQNVEVIIVDDAGPDDGTEQITRSFVAESRNGERKVIRHEKNQGVSASRNTAIANSTGDFVAFLDPDDIWLPHFLETAVDIFSNPDIDAICGNCIIFSGPTPNTASLNLSGALAFSQQEPLWFPASISARNFIQPSGAIVRKDIINKIGGFTLDPNLQHVEDWDLWIRLIQAGSTFAFILQPVCLYRKHQNGATANVPLMEKRISRLINTHRSFFDLMNASLLRQLLLTTSQTETQNKNLENGILFRAIRLIDRKINRILKNKHNVNPSTASNLTKTPDDHYLLLNYHGRG